MGELFNKLSVDDVNMIDKWIDSKVSSAHREVSYLLREWDRQKPTLYKMFGDQFILNKKIEYNKPLNNLKNELRDKFNDYSNVCNKFRRTFDRLLWENRIALGYDYDLLQCLMDVDKLINTEYDGDTFYVNSPDGKPVKVQHGCKPMRLISKISRLYGMDLDLLTAFQNEVSMVLNQKKLTGDLTISIHPMDYMTMSENDCDWSSCMNWSEPGCYCRGTVEMMNSPYVVVAYLNADRQMRVPGSYNWSNKKWRELFIVTDQVITGVKGYPYQNEDLVKIVNSWLRDLAVANLGWKFDKNNVAYQHNDLFSYTDDCGNPHDARLQFRTNTMYNDFGTIDYHYAILGTDLDSYKIHVDYSGEEECMVCGSLTNEFDGEGMLICYDCDDSTYCAGCGDRVYNGDIYYLDDEPYCRYCYDEHVRIDAITGDEHHENNMTTIYLIKDNFAFEDVEDHETRATNIRYNSIGNIEVYNGSWDYNRWSRYFNTQPNYVSYGGWYSNRTYFVKASDLTDKGWELYDLDKEDYLD